MSFQAAASGRDSVPPLTVFVRTATVSVLLRVQRLKTPASTGRLVQRIQEHLRRVAAAEDGRLIGPVGGKNRQHGHLLAAEQIEHLGHFRVAVRPVGHQRHDAAFDHRLADSRRVQHVLLQSLARHAPIGREIDQDGLPLGDRLLEGRPAERLPGQLVFALRTREASGHLLVEAAERVLAGQNLVHAGKQQDSHQRDEGRAFETRPDPRAKIGGPRRAADPPAGRPEGEQQADRGNDGRPVDEGEDVDHGAQQHETHDLLEGFHPRAGPGQEADQPGKGPDQQVGAGHAQPDAREDGEHLRRRLPHGPGQRRAHERGGAGRGQDRGEHAFGERAGDALLLGPFGRLAAPDEAGDGNLPHAQEAQAPSRTPRTARAMLNGS